MPELLGALLIFVLRITDVSIGTIRVILMIRGKRLPVVLLGFLESGIFIFAISRVMAEMGTLKMVFYAAGFACGTFLGMTLERLVAGGWIIARIVSREHCTALAATLRGEHFGVTMVRGEGREGETGVLFIVTPRRRGDELLELIRKQDPDAFVTIDPVSQAIGGYIPSVVESAAMKK